MSKIAQELQRQLDEMRRESARNGRRTKKMIDDETVDVTNNDDLKNDATAAIAETTAVERKPIMTTQKKMKAMAPRKKATAPQKLATTKVQKPKAPRDATAGVRKRPKNKRLFISPQAQELVKRLLSESVRSGELSADDRYEADRMLARIAARE
jgi:hypothetical protein